MLLRRKRQEMERPKVLCVAQLPSLLNSLQAVLQPAGYEVLQAYTADQAVAICVGQQVQAVILDAELMRVKGYSGAEALKLVRPAVPIMLLDHRTDPARKDGPPKGVDSSVFGMSAAAILAGLADLLGNNTATKTGSK